MEQETDVIQEALGGDRLAIGEVKTLKTVVRKYRQPSLRESDSAGWSVEAQVAGRPMFEDFDEEDNADSYFDYLVDKYDLEEVTPE